MIYSGETFYETMRGNNMDALWVLFVIGENKVCIRTEALMWY